jgi:hypothetical protein
MKIKQGKKGTVSTLGSLYTDSIIKSPTYKKAIVEKTVAGHGSRAV